MTTTPVMRLVVHSQGSSLSHGSFEDLISTLRQDHRQGTRKETLTKKGHESLQMAHNHIVKHWQIPQTLRRPFVVNGMGTL